MVDGRVVAVHGQDLVAPVYLGGLRVTTAYVSENGTSTIGLALHGLFSRRARRAAPGTPAEARP